MVRDDVGTPQTIPWMSHAFFSLILQALTFVVIWNVFQWIRIRTLTATHPTTAHSGIKGKLSGHWVDSGPCNTSNANKTREPGVWTPQKINYPEILPCPHGIMEVQPIPYRPFRWGEYHVTMGIRSMPWSEWIELDLDFVYYQRVRQFRLRTRGGDVVRVLPSRVDGVVIVPGGADAAKELLYEVAEYVVRRYPRSFQVTRLQPSAPHIPSIGGIPLSWDDRMPIQAITALATGVTYDFSKLETLHCVDMGEQAMRIVTGLVQEDMAIMIEGFWRMKDKIGKPLDEIHLSGNVPQFKEKLKMSMERFFGRMAVDKPVIRNNYFIQVVKPSKDKRAADDGRSFEIEEETTSDVDPEELGWSESTNGPEDSLEQGHGHSADPAAYLRPSTLRLRNERQTLRRLPRTGAIVFGIRTYLFKVEDLVRERGVAGRLASAVRSWPEDVAVYKGRKMYRDRRRGLWTDQLKVRCRILIRSGGGGY
ncbi:hypothetical protein EDD15DRAFT_2222996 [Pisolithus albus]|nr:hypothetical protein EDD15DRAFT_2222996 [Pisolithus albus]